jgi:ADP-ribose pyrophosphatase YjhB (NUDIX family)
MSESTTIPPPVLPPRQHFHHCPRCAKALAGAAEANRIECTACGFLLYFNPTVAGVAFASREDGRVLFIRRAKEPGKDLLAPPGGFIDLGETAEVAVEREYREEVGVRIADVTFLSSQVNQYAYRGVLYPVLDLFFTARAVNPTAAQSLDDVAGFEWRDPLTVAEDELAFPSMKAALRVLQARLRNPTS